MRTGVQFTNDARLNNGEDLLLTSRREALIKSASLNEFNAYAGEGGAKPYRNA